MLCSPPPRPCARQAGRLLAAGSLLRKLSASMQPPLPLPQLAHALHARYAAWGTPGGGGGGGGGGAGAGAGSDQAASVSHADAGGVGCVDGGDDGGSRAAARAHALWPSVAAEEASMRQFVASVAPLLAELRPAAATARRGRERAEAEAAAVEAGVSPFLAFLACIGSPCLRHCLHGASIGGGGGGGSRRRR
jgi:hypothetical protein